MGYASLMKQNAPATRRNRDPILDVLRQHLPDSGTVLEIASGTGEHTLYFANAFPSLLWQPSDKNQQALDSIDAWATDAKHDNINKALVLDVTQQPWPMDGVDCILCINMIHIAPWEACSALFTGAKQALSQEGLMYLYGPFFRVETEPEPSNLTFDRSLRNQNPKWGIRHLERVCAEAQKSGFTCTQTVEMPANNLSVLFRNNAS